MLVSLTFDVEPDCPPYLTTAKGVVEGLPRILDILDRKNIKATFFFTAEVAKRFPQLARRVVDEGHELGSHAYSHERLDKLNRAGAERAIEKSLSVLRKFDDVVSFRAPNLQLPSYLFSSLKENGVLVDSSKATYKGYGGVGFIGGILEIPVSTTSSVLRLPWKIQKIIHGRLKEPKVYFEHPWEFVDMRKKNIRHDCKFNTGKKALELLENLIEYYTEKDARFVLIRDYFEIYSGYWKLNTVVF